MNDFSKSTLRALAKRGVTLVGLQALPNANGSFANCETGYVVNHNGTGKVWTFAQMLEAAK